MKIRIFRQRIFARHGVLPQEQTVGGDFLVNTEVETDVTAATLSDQLSDTVSYADIAQLVQEEMSQPSQLLEHVAHRIASRLLRQFPAILRATVEVIKLNPPMGIECGGAGVEVTLSR